MILLSFVACDMIIIICNYLIGTWKRRKKIIINQTRRILKCVRIIRNIMMSCLSFGFVVVGRDAVLKREKKNRYFNIIAAAVIT